MQNDIQNSPTVFFTGWSDFSKKTTGRKIYVALNGIQFCSCVSKKSLKEVYDGMSETGFGQKFQGKIIYTNSNSVAQVVFNNI